MTKHTLLSVTLKKNKVAHQQRVTNFFPFTKLMLQIIIYDALENTTLFSS